MKTLADYFAARVTEGPTDQCWLWTGNLKKRWPDTYGYSFHKDAYNEGAHRLAYRLTHGPIPPGQLVRHTCDNPPCCNPSHLVLGSHADNAADKVMRGRHVKVRRDATAKTKVTSWQLKALRREFWALPRTPTGKLKAGYVGPLAAKYNITPGHLTELGRST